MRVSNVRVVDVRTGQITEPQTISFSNSYILSIEKALPSDTGYDARGGYVVPGFIDLHVHVCLEPRSEHYEKLRYGETDGIAFLRARRNLGIALKAGITLVRDVGCANRAVLRVRDALQLGALSGPRILAAGKLLTGTAGWGSRLGREVQSTVEARHAVRDEIEHGADLIKIINDPIAMSEDIVMAIVDEAHRLQKRVAYHAFSDDAIAIGVAAGVDTIEHAAPRDERLLARCIEKGITLVPTLVCALDTTSDLEISHCEEGLSQTYQDWLHTLTVGLPTAFKRGAKVACGTDAGFPPTDFGAAVREAQEFVKLGATTLQALQALTLFAAAAAGVGDRLGAVESGMIADLVILRNNPIADVRALCDVRAVVIGGELAVSHGEIANIDSRVYGRHYLRSLMPSEVHDGR